MLAVGAGERDGRGSGLPLAAALLGVVSVRPLVGVVGASGSGKSSLVRAGLVPVLRSGRIAGSDEWLSTDFYPGADPFTSLAEAVGNEVARLDARFPEQLLEAMVKAGGQGAGGDEEAPRAPAPGGDA